jgi:hypothetical protein
MVSDHSLALEEAVGGGAKVPRPEDAVTDLSFGGDTSDRSRDNIGDHGEESGAVDPCKYVRSYDFGPLTVTVGRIRQLKALGYFAKGSAHEPGDEIIPELVADEAIMFEEFFAAGLGMPPHPMLTDILVKFRVQIH